MLPNKPFNNNIKRAVLIRDQLQEYLKQIINERKKKIFFENIAKSKSNPDSL